MSTRVSQPRSQWPLWLTRSHFGLEAARAAAATVLSEPSLRAVLMKALFNQDADLRCRAADIARRISERDRDFLSSHAAELIGLCASLPLAENRARWHLTLVAARSARTRMDVRRCAAVLLSMARDPSNVVRCSVIEGFAELTLCDASLRAQAEELIESALLTGTKAMACRAKHARRKLVEASHTVS